MAVHRLGAAQLFGALETLVQNANRLAAAALSLRSAQCGAAQLVGRGILRPVEHRAACVGEAELRSPPLANEFFEHDDGVEILMSLDVHVLGLNCIRQLEAGSIAPRKKV